MELNKTVRLHKNSSENLDNIKYELKIFKKARYLEDALKDKSQNTEMKKVINYYETYFDEESGNTREQGIEELQQYLNTELKGHTNTVDTLKTKVGMLKQEINKRKMYLEENNNPDEANPGKLASIFPIIPLNSFIILRLLSTILSFFIWFKLINLDFNYFMLNIPEITIPTILISIVLFIWEYLRLFSKVRNCFKFGKKIYIFCKEKFDSFCKKKH